jgi:hypothetical protein
MSANGVRAFPKEKQTLHGCAPSWLQRHSGNICIQNLLCGYASYDTSGIDKLLHVLYIMPLSVTQAIECRMTGWQWTVYLKECGRKQAWPSWK